MTGAIDWWINWLITDRLIDVLRRLGSISAILQRYLYLQYIDGVVTQKNCIFWTDTYIFWG